MVHRLVNMLHLAPMLAILLNSRCLAAVSCTENDSLSITDCPENCTCLISGHYSRLDIDCGGLSLTDFDSSLCAMWNQSYSTYSSLTELTLSQSELISPEDACLCQLQSLEKLNFTKNHLLSTLGELGCFPKLQTLWVETNYNLTDIDIDTFKGASQLQEIHLRDNWITTIHPQAFLQVSPLYVDLGENSFHSVDIWPLVLLSNRTRYVSFRNNLVSAFTNIHNISLTDLNPSGTLDLSYNQICYISNLAVGWGFDHMYEIRRIMFPGNFYLELDQNPLECDCVDYSIIVELKKVSPAPHVSVLQCYYPEVLREEHVIALTDSDMVCEHQCHCCCQCREDPAARSYHVDCSGSNMGQVPKSILAGRTRLRNFEYRYNLSFRNSALHSLEGLPYVPAADVADFRDNFIRELSREALSSLQSTEMVRLDYNNITRLDKTVEDLDLSNITVVLENNPWHCNCDNLWFKDWLSSDKAPKGINYQNISCVKPESLANRLVTEVSDVEFCPVTLDPSSGLDTGIVVLISFLLPITTAFLVVLGMFASFRFRVWLYAKTQWHPFDLDECIGENKAYDVFISYAEEDQVWVMDLIDRLEAEGYKTLFHKRDFLPGMPTTENVGKAVMDSKRTVCVLTPDFVKSAMCNWEFVSVLNNDLLDNKRRLVLLVKELVPEEDRSLSLRGYMRNYTYIEAWADYFWDRLRYCLPVNKKGNK